MSEALIEEAWALLSAHDLVPAGAQIAELPERADVRSRFGIAITEALQDRVVFFDTEYIYDENDYAELTATFAAATLGEWQPENLRSYEEHEDVDETLRHDDADWFDHVIEFTAWGERFTRRFSWYCTDWVAVSFFDLIESFAEERLSGAFVQMPVTDQCYWGVYLPKKVAAKLEAIIERLDHEYPQRFEP